MPAAVARTLTPFTAGTRAAALEAFRDEHPGLRLPPVAVVIAALDEEDCLGDVLADIPAEVCGRGVATIVVDDGSSDATSEVARRAGVLVARLERNCGHGIALRVGYELAREHGAEVIATLDADGQWDPAELERVAAPVLEGEADFVIGSRVLGSTETDDDFRQAGVHVFAALVRLLTGVRVTDTSSGYRVLRADITAAVRQEQVQYQTSELLIGAIAAGYRIAERPIVMRKRLAGESKKGHNVLYGARYARVILRTAWRERRALVRRRADRRPRDAEKRQDPGM
jgi:glycosyltransferase involved in cell wall biosynthesis